MHEAAGDGGANRIRLAHHAPAAHVDRDIDGLRFLSCEPERLEDFHPREIVLNDLHRSRVDADDTRALGHGRTGDRRLSLPARHDDLQNDPPSRSAISPMVMYRVVVMRSAPPTRSKG